MKRLWTRILFFLLPFSIVFAQNNPAAIFDTNGLNQSQKTRQKKQAQKRFQLKYSSAYYYQLANKLKEQGQLRQAVQNYEYAILLNNECANCYRSLGEIYYFLKQYTESISYLQTSLRYKFDFEFDRIKAQYLLVSDFFRTNQNSEAIKILNQLSGEYQSNIDRQAINGLNMRYEYYAPAFFLLSLYHRNQGDVQDNIIILQKALQLGFKKEYTDYFFYEYYQSKGQDSIAWEYLKQAKEIDPKIEQNIKVAPFLKNYDIYMDVIKS